MGLVLVLSIFLLLIFIKYVFKRPIRFPPGPPYIPIAGSVPFLRGLGVEKYVSDKIASYGPVTGMYLGSYPFIMINDWKLAKSLFLREEFSGRISNHTTNWARSTAGVSLGVVMTEGPRWTGQRNFTVKQLKNFGFGKNELEAGIYKEAKDLVEHMMSQGEEIKIDSSLFALPVLNVLWNMVAGQTFSREDSRIQKLLDLNTFLFSSEIFMIALHAPWVRHVLPSISGYDKWLEGVNGIKDRIRFEIEEHEATLDVDNPRDFIDTYLIEMKSNPDPEFSKEQLVMIGHDLMSAGSETVATTLNWIILYLTIQPTVQERCYQEIEEVIGQKSVALSDTSRLHYCQATIAEIQRVSQVAVSSIQHRVTRQVTLPTGHVIPAGTVAMTNIRKFLSDPLLWDSPHIFSPDRFLNSAGNFFRPDHFVPLGHGRRVCMGEPLARAELFIFFVCIVQRLRLEPVEGRIPNPEKYSAGLTRCPHDFVVAVKNRRSMHS